MNRRKYLASLGLIGIGGYATYNATSQPAIATNIDLPHSITASENITEQKNPKIQLSFDKFIINEQNYYGETPNYTVTARTIYDDSESDEVILVENKSLTENNELENIKSKNHTIPLQLPNTFDDIIPITIKFKFNTDNNKIGPFIKEYDVQISRNETYLYEDWSDEFNEWNTGGDTGGSGGSYNHSISNDSISGNGKSARLYGDGNCGSSPYDGTSVWATKDISLDEGTYEIEYYSKVENYGYYSVGSNRTANEGRVYLDNDRIAMIEDMCSTDGCSTDWMYNKQEFNVDSSGVYELKLQYSTGDCSDGYVFWDDIGIRKIN